MNLKIGYILGIFGVITAIFNGFVHVVVYIKTRSYKGTMDAGVFTGIPLAIIGFVVSILIILSD